VVVGSTILLDGSRRGGVVALSRAERSGLGGRLAPADLALRGYGDEGGKRTHPIQRLGALNTVFTGVMVGAAEVRITEQSSGAIRDLQKVCAGQFPELASRLRLGGPMSLEWVISGGCEL